MQCVGGGVNSLMRMAPAVAILSCALHAYRQLATDLNETLSASAHSGPMAALSNIEPVAAYASAQTRHQKGGERAAANFGAAMTHREQVAAKVRVDPAALAEKKRATPHAREHPSEEAPPGSYLDVRV